MHFARAQRGRFGVIYLRFGEPISLQEAIGPPGRPATEDSAARALTLNKLAFEVSSRINAATPITGTGLAAIALLGARDVPLTLRQMGRWAVGLCHPRAALRPAAHSRRGGRRSRHAGQGAGCLRGSRRRREPSAGWQDLYRVSAAGHLKIAYYRNSLIHFFLPDAIAELALIAAAADGSGAAGVAEHALAIRDLLKFEFFFEEKDKFMAALTAGLERLDSDWATAVARGPAGVRRLLVRAPILCSDMMLRSFFEAYLVAADVIVDAEPDHLKDNDELFEACEERGIEYLRQGKLRNPESISRYLFTTGLTLAGYRGLLDPDAAAGRAALAAELRQIVAHMGIVHRVAVRRILKLAGDRGGRIAAATWAR